MHKINILAVADIHYVGLAKHVCNIENRRTEMGIKFIHKILNNEDMDKIGLILLLGDLVDNGDAIGAEEDIKAIKYELEKIGKPMVVVPGNHDGRPQRVLSIFNDHEGFHEIEGYQIITFSDKYGNNDTCTRSMEKMESIFAHIDSERPIIVMQHNPVYPAIDCSYPYNISNACDVMKYYTDKIVTLSISGHAHWGISAVEKDKVGYLTCPALCEAPYRYTLISLDGKQFEIKYKSLI